MKKNAEIRVLHVTGGFRKGVSGGIPSVLYNYCTAKAFDDYQVGFDFLALGYQTFEPYRRELEAIGGILYNLGIHVDGMRRNIQIFTHLRKFLVRHKGEYDIVHINSGALVQVLACAMAAKSAGIKRIIVHSHNAIRKDRLHESIYRFLKPMFYLCADDYFACAGAAAASMFPGGIIKKHRWTFVPNAIDCKRYQYDASVREQYRNELELTGKYVIGHIGRFSPQKNHEFLLPVFAEVCKKRKDAVLLLVGTGELQGKMEELAKGLGVWNRVIFAGQRRDANCLIQAMDVMAFPSLYEGLGMALIEAQVSGLKVFASDRVPFEETHVTDGIEYLSLEDRQAWIDKISALAEYERIDRTREITAAGYEIETAALALKWKYIKNT